MGAPPNPVSHSNVASMFLMLAHVLINMISFWAKRSKFQFSSFTMLQMLNQQKLNMIVLWLKFVMKSHDNHLNPYSYFFVISVTVPCEPSCNPDALSSILTHTGLCTSWFYAYFSFIYFPFLPNLFSNENHLHYHVNYVTKKILWKSRGVSKVFLADQVRWCYMRTEHISYQGSFVIPSTIF